MAGGGFTGHDVHIDVPLSQVAIAYNPKGFIADQIAPIVGVNKQSDGYYIWDIADAYRVEDSKRAPGAEANVIERSVSSGTYFAKNYAFKDRIPYEDIKNVDAGAIFLERQARAEFIKSKLYLDWERRVALMVTSGSNCGSYDSVDSGWTDKRQNYSDPLGCINTAILNVEGLTGVRPNSILFGRYAWHLFRQHQEVKDCIFGTAGAASGGRVVTLENVKTLFEVERALVGGAYYNSADEGQAASLARIWNDQVLVYYAPMAASKTEPSFMYSFRWDAVPGMNMTAEVFDLPRNKAEEVQLGYYQDEKITAKTLGFLIVGVGSSQ